MNVIEVKNVSVTYQNGRKIILAVNDVSFTVTKGDYLCIIGDNGSGKSSLVKAIIGINNVSAGQIKLNVEKNLISYLSQSTEIPVDFPATVKEIVLCGTQSSKNFFLFYRKKNYEMTEHSMELLGISDLKNRRFGELSGGQRQRVLLARSICKNPEVLILDEPFSGLDVSISSSLYEILKKLNKKLKTTIIMVTHDQRDVLNNASHVVEMDKSLSFYGTKDQWILKRKRGEME